jgi:hypothetical protein
VRKTTYILPGFLLILVVLGAFIFLFRAELMAYIVDPVARLFWAIWGILSRLDQRILWDLVIFLAATLSFLLFPSTRYESQNNTYNYQFHSKTKVAFWLTLLKKRNLEADGNQSLVQAARKLSNDYLEMESGQHKGSPARNLLNKIPDNVAWYLGIDSQPRITFWKRCLNTIYFLTPAFIRKWMGIQRVPVGFIDTIAWLERELGIEEEGVK